MFDIKIGVDGLVLRKDKDRQTDILTIVTAVFDSNGLFVKGLQHKVDLKLREETRAKLIEQGGMTLKGEILVPSGNYLVRLVVRDGQGNTMATRNGIVEIPF